MKVCYAACCFLLLLFAPDDRSLFGQSSFLDLFGQVETWANSRIAAMPDGGFITGNDLRRPPEGSSKHGFYLARYDTCGTIGWARAMSHPDFALFFQAVASLPSGDVVAAGSTGNQDIFLVRLDPAGEVVYFRTYDASDYDDVGAIGIDGEEILLYGVYLDGNQPRHYAMRTDGDGLPIWSRAYGLEDGGGDMTVNADGKLFCRSGNIFFLLSADGAVEWSVRFNDLNPVTSNFSNLATPGDGFAFDVRFGMEHTHYVVGLNLAGAVSWVSPLVSAFFTPSALAADKKGNLVMVNAFPPEGTATTATSPFAMVLNGQGQIVKQYRFNLDDLGEFKAPAVTYLPDDGIAIKGTYFGESHLDYTVKFTPDVALGCVTEVFESSKDNPTQPASSAVSLPNRTLSFTVSDSLSVTAAPMNIPTNRRCGATIEDKDWPMWERVNCTDTFHFKGPVKQAVYTWEDGFTQPDRILKAEGVFKVDAAACNANYHIEIDLEQGLCPCQLYKPNAFSPNHDDINDTFQVYADCPFLNFELQIFDRWGQMVFQTQNPDDGWDGKTRTGADLPMGVYVFRVAYEWEVIPGQRAKRQETGSISIIR